MKTNVLNQKIIDNLVSNLDREILFFPDSKLSFSGRDLLDKIELVVEEFLQENVELIVLDLSNSEEFIVSFLSGMFLGLDLLILNPNESENKKKTIVNFFNRKNKVISKCRDVWNKSSRKLDFKAAVEGKNSKIYIPTSSTTGDSKIVPHSVEMIISNVESVVEHHRLCKNTTISTSLPLYHVNALYFTFLASFSIGGRVVIHQVANVKKMIECIPIYEVDIISMIPTLIDSIIRNIETIDIKKFKKLSYVVSAAAPLSKSTTMQFYNLTKKRIIQGYGLSEAINFSCTIPIDLKQDEYETLLNVHATPTIGIALSCNQVEIIGDCGKLCDEGEVGEIVISGKNVFNGYFSNESNNKASDKLYTGDIGYWSIFNGSKYFFITSRLKEIAKINGESVSLRELDEIYGAFEDLDFYTVSFKNEYQGEAIALICSNILKGEKLERFIANIRLKGELLPSTVRGRVLVLVEQALMRTASGKAKRWSWEKQFLQFQKLRLGSKLIIIKEN